MEFYYMKLANELEQKIRSGRFAVGERLPSLRAMRRQTGRSISTVYHAYEELEQRGVIDVREKSGFFVRPRIEKIMDRPRSGEQEIIPVKVTRNEMAALLQRTNANPDVLSFGTALAGPELLPGKQLARELRRAAGKWATGEMLGYSDPTGYRPLRREIEKRMIGCFNSIQGDEVVITGGCLAAIDLCLRAVAGSGDIILVESPTFLCYLQLIEDLNMRALEIPVHSDTGLDINLLKEVLASHQVSAALLNGNFHNPLGYVISDENKQEIVNIFQGKNIPIIEDDIYGDLFFGETRPLPLKFFDREGLVLYCSSFTKTMAPDLRIGWTVPGRFREKIKRMKFNSSVASQQMSQAVIASFLSSGAHDRHLRKMRNSLKKQLGALLNAIAEYFPSGTRVSMPQGGLCLWVELEKPFDTMHLFKEAAKSNIALVPGTFCSATMNFEHCMRLNFGYPWTERSEQGMKVLAEIIRQQRSGVAG